MKDLLDYLVKSLVTNPEQVVVKEDLKEGMANYSLSVATEDMGMVIGKAGQTIKAIRKLLIARALAENNTIKVNVTIEESAK